MIGKTSTWRVNSPCVTLYAFHLRDEISKGPEQIQANHLWEQCVALGAEDKLNIPTLRSLRTQLLCYENDAPDGYNPSLETADNLPLLKKPPRVGEDRFLRFRAASTPGSSDLQGEIYPRRIHDTYALDLSLRYRETVDISYLKHFNPKGCLLPRSIQASLGQTLVIFADPTAGPEDDQAIAAACVDAFFQDTNQPSPELLVAGQLLGSPIFEYDTDSENPLEQCHLLVWLQRHPDTLALSTQAYHYLLQLLSCRSKILYAYHQARRCNNQARQIYRQLETKVEEFCQMPAKPENLEERTARLAQLKSWLTEIQQTGFRYAHHLRDMEDHQTAIAINSENYRSLLTKIQVQSLPDDNLDFFQNFLDRICQQFQDQIQVDLRYLTPSQGLFQQMLDTIRGIAEIEAEEQAQVREQSQKERDRNLQDTIQCLGIGIGAASIVGSTVGYLTQKESVSCLLAPIPSIPSPYRSSLALLPLEFSGQEPGGLVGSLILAATKQQN